MNRNKVPGATGSDVLIVGGGLQGLSSALQLARRGFGVRLVEAEYCGRHASGVNAGGVRTLGRHLAEIPLALSARDEFWHHLREFLDDDGGFVASGQLQVAENEADIASAQRRIAELQVHGFTHECWVDQAQARELVPSIAGHVLGGIWVERDGHALPYRVVTAFRRAALAAGVVVHENCPVRRIECHGELWQVHTDAACFECDYVVNTSGAWAGTFAEQLGDTVPLAPGGLMLMVTQRMAPFVKPVLGARGRPLSFKQFDNGTVLIGGGLRCSADAARRYAAVDLASMTRSAQTVVDLFPHLHDALIVRAWAGVEGFLPDQIPVLGPSAGSARAIHAFGFSAHGFELSPVVGQIVADLIERRSTRWPIEAFSIGRFAPGNEHPVAPLNH